LQTNRFLSVSNRRGSDFQEDFINPFPHDLNELAVKKDMKNLLGNFIAKRARLKRTMPFVVIISCVEIEMDLFPNGAS